MHRFSLSRFLLPRRMSARLLASLLSLLLPILLVAQQGAFVHSLTHLPSRIGTATAPDEHGNPGEPYCEKCFSFSQVGAAVSPPAAAALAIVAVFLAIAFAPLLPARPAWQAPRNRGPPALP